MDRRVIHRHSCKLFKFLAVDFSCHVDKNIALSDNFDRGERAHCRECLVDPKRQKPYQRALLISGLDDDVLCKIIFRIGIRFHVRFSSFVLFSIRCTGCAKSIIHGYERIRLGGVPPAMECHRMLLSQRARGISRA